MICTVPCLTGLPSPLALLLLLSRTVPMSKINGNIERQTDKNGAVHFLRGPCPSSVFPYILCSCLPLVTESGGCELVPQQKDPCFDSGAWVHSSSFIPIGQNSSQQYIRRLFFLYVIESLRRREPGSPFLSSVWGLKVMADRTQFYGPWGYLQRPNNKATCTYAMMTLWSQFGIHHINKENVIYLSNGKLFSHKE